MLTKHCALGLVIVLAALGCGCNVAPSSNQKATNGSAANLAVGSSQVSFGNVSVGSSKSGSLTISNSAGSKVSATISKVQVTGSEFTLSSVPSVPFVLAAGTSLKLGITFKPKGAGSVAGSLAINSDATTPTIDVPLIGSGQSAAATLALSPSTLSFGNVLLGASKSQTGKLTATGSGITISTLDRNGEGYSVSGLSFPLTLAAGKSVSFTVTFQPAQAGSSPGQLTFLSTANSASAVLTGSGTQTAQHQVNLSWNQSSLALGYNLYRGTRSGGPYSRLNSLLELNTDFTDASVQSGATYYYVATSIDLAHIESGYSNETKAVIPTP